MEEVTTKVERPKRSFGKRWVFALGLLVGLIGFIVYRAAMAKDPNVHYHANFAVYLNGKQDTFDGPGFYEEVAACNVHDADDVKSRTHMHDNVNHVIHVHAHGVTWGAFFANLGYSLGDNVFSNGTEVFANDQDGKQLTFMLNGKKATTIADTVIKSEDVLLINYGDENDQAIQKRYDAIPKDAHHYNVTKDPAACSGGDVFDWKARVKEAVGLRSTH